MGRLLNKLTFTALSLLFAIPTFAQQIGNPSAQHGVTFPRGVYAIRNARVVTGRWFNH